MEAGHPRAAFLLAETFDPHVLSRLGALGIRGDAGKARELYARARSLGDRPGAGAHRSLEVKRCGSGRKTRVWDRPAVEWQML